MYIFFQSNTTFIILTFIVMYVLYSDSLRCFVYRLCVNVYLELPPGLNPIAVNKIYHVSIYSRILRTLPNVYQKTPFELQLKDGLIKKPKHVC